MHTETLVLDQAMWNQLARGDEVSKVYKTPFGKILLILKREISAGKGA